MQATPRRFVLGTRGSPLALVQAGMVRDALLAQVPASDALEVTVETIRTSGDQILDRPLHEMGGKGLFTKEIDEALLAGRIDLAVHSLKDVPALLPDGIAIAAVLERADPRDVLLAKGSRSLAELPPGAVVGTSSPRRAAQIMAIRPDLRVVPLRGNVGTRMAKLAEGAADATLLAAAGLARLGLAPAGATPLELDEMLPAVAQGAVAIACRSDDGALREHLAAVDHAPTAARVAAERAMLLALGGSCRTPIAGHARLIDGGVLALDGLAAAPDGHAAARDRVEGPVGDLTRLGQDLGDRLRARADPRWFDP